MHFHYSYLCHGITWKIELLLHRRPFKLVQGFQKRVGFFFLFQWMDFILEGFFFSDWHVKLGIVSAKSMLFSNLAAGLESLNYLCIIAMIHGLLENCKVLIGFPPQEIFLLWQNRVGSGALLLSFLLLPRGSQWLLSSGKREFGSTAIQGQFWIIVISKFKSFLEICQAMGLCKVRTGISEPEKLGPAGNTGHPCFTFFYFHVKYHWCVLQRDLDLVVGTLLPLKTVANFPLY